MHEDIVKVEKRFVSCLDRVTCTIHKKMLETTSLFTAEKKVRVQNTTILNPSVAHARTTTAFMILKLHDFKRHGNSIKNYNLFHTQEQLAQSISLMLCNIQSRYADYFRFRLYETPTRLHLTCL